MVQSSSYLIIECNQKKSLVRCIDWLAIETVHVIMEISKLITYILYEIFVKNKPIIYSITMQTNRTVSQSFDDYLKTDTLFGEY